MRQLSIFSNSSNPAFLNLVFKLLGFGIAFLASAYSAQSYGPSQFGLVILAIFAQYMLCELTDLGYSTYLARRIAQNNLPFQEWLSHIPRILFRSLLAMGMWIIGITLFIDEKFSVHLLLVLNIPFWLCNSYFQQVAYAKGELNLANLEVFMQNSLLIVVFPISLITPHFYEIGIVLASFISFLFSFSASVSRVKGNGNTNVRRFPKFDLQILRNDGIKLASSRILGIATYLDTLAMGILLGPVVAGFYALASRMRAVLPAGLISISDSTYSRALSTKHLSEILGSLGNKIIAALTIAISGFIFFNTTPLILHIYGPAYSDSAVYFKFFVIISLIIGFIHILRRLLIAWDEDEFIRRNVYFSVFIQVILSIALVLTYTSYAIPTALLLSNLFLMCAFGFKIRSIKASK